MSLNEAEQIRSYLCSSSTVTSYVPKGNILFAWPKIPEKLPCIIVNQAGGTDVYYMGSKTASAGTRNRRSTETYQIDVLSATSRRDTMLIGDAITPLLMISGNYRKSSELDTYTDELSAYRKILIFTKNVINVQD